jgi:HD superfamily phosphodiesterase
MPTAPRYATVGQEGYHSLEHLHFVGRIAAFIALDEDEDPFPALVAGALHDLRREDDGPGLDHAVASASVAERILSDQFAPYLNRESVPHVIRAIREHPRGRTASNYIEASLWDADRLRLAWERGYRAKFFNTRLGAELAQGGEEYTEQCFKKYFCERRGDFSDELWDG